MNTRLLRMARRFSDGSRQWVVPGEVNAIKTISPECSTWGGWAIAWPDHDASGPVVRIVDLRRHPDIARNEIRKLLERKRM